MLTSLVLCLVCVTSGTLIAQEAQVTPLISNLLGRAATAAILTPLSPANILKVHGKGG